MLFSSRHAPCGASPGGGIGVLTERRYLRQAQPLGLVDALRRRGADVRVLVAEDAAVDLRTAGWLDGVDVLVARGRSSAVLATLRAAEELGVSVVDRASAIGRVVDKAGMTASMAVAGLATPASWLGAPARLATEPDLPFPLILKPVTGDNARGLRVVGSRDELAAVSWPEPVAIAQQFLRGDGEDIKLYVAGSHVWAVRRPSPIEPDGSARVEGDAGQPVRVTPALRAIALRCSELFGLRLLGIDCVPGPDGEPVVIEVNDFPNYRGLGSTVNDVLAGVVLDLLPARATSWAALAVPGARREPAPLEVDVAGLEAVRR